MSAASSSSLDTPTLETEEQGKQKYRQLSHVLVKRRAGLKTRLDSLLELYKVDQFKSIPNSDRYRLTYELRKAGLIPKATKSAELAPMMAERKKKRNQVLQTLRGIEAKVEALSAAITISSSSIETSNSEEEKTGAIADQSLT
jgi:hypothetical protein